METVFPLAGDCVLVSVRVIVFYRTTATFSSWENLHRVLFSVLPRFISLVFFCFDVHSCMFLSYCELPCIQMAAFATVSGSIKDVITKILPTAPCPGLSIISHWLHLVVGL